MLKKLEGNPARRSGVSRREVLKWCAGLGGAALLPGDILPYGLRFAEAAATDAAEQSVFSGCTVNCGSQCALRVFFRDGRITRIESDPEADTPASRSNRACVRGRSMRQWVYSPDRVKYPMRRVPGAKRGEGRFERISWDEALDEVARQWVRVLKEYGPEAIHRMYGSGTTSSGITRRNEWFRLANMLGGHLDEYGDYSSAQISFAMPFLYGARDNNNIQALEDSKLVVLFGSNILEVRQSGGGLAYALLEAKRKSGARCIVLDPRYSDTAAKLADQWIPVRPGSDGAMCAAIAHVLISENLADQSFLDKYCLGFDEAHMPEGVPAGNSYKSYVLGLGPDGLAKTPEWAASITGCPAETIVKLAREIGSAKPCAIVQGYGPQRQASGDSSTRAIAMLSILTGNVGISGGGTGSNETVSQTGFPRMPDGSNPVKTRISFFTWINAIDDYTQVTASKMGLQGKDKLDSGIKFIWNSAGNALINQHSDINGTGRILQDESKCEFIVVVETRMTSSAMFADILLPSVTPPEQDDLIRQGYQVNQDTVLVARQAVMPVFEAKSQYDICWELAKKIGPLIGQPDLADRYCEGRTQLDWTRHLYAETRKMKPELPEDFEEASRIGLFKWWPTNKKIAFKAFRDNPEANPLKTPSGKIEVFSKRLWDMNKNWELPEGESIHAIAVHEKTWEGPDDYEGKKQHPFQLIGHHYKGRTHSTYADLPWLMQVAPQQLWMNVKDAEDLGVKHGETVKVHNERGALLAQVKVTPRIMPGVLSLPQGAWYKPDKNGLDHGACINTITKTHMTPLSKGNPQHTNLVSVSKL